MCPSGTRVPAPPRGLRYRGGMDYTHLGRSGVSVSRICLGTMNFGAATEPADAHVIMDHALEAGISFWDTSKMNV
jgi:aryl-alcohol dehydrogenase-like predicted oxidoreductase